MYWRSEIKILSFTSLAFTLALSSAAFGFGNGGQNQGRGNGGGDGMPAFMAGWDSNENGVVELEEAKSRRGDFFDALDANSDGKLLQAEFDTFIADQTGDHSGKSHGRAMRGMSMNFNDANLDGLVTPEEFVSQTKQWLNGMDRNGDGKVTLSDFGRGH